MRTSQGIREPGSIAPYPDMPNRKIQEHGHESLISALSEFCIRLDREDEYRKRKETAIWEKTVPGLLVLLSDGAGTLTGDRSLRPESGCMLAYRRLTLTGWTAGTVSVTIDNAEPIPVPAPGMYTFGKRELLLSANQSLYIAATGITGYVQVWGSGDEFEDWYFAEYVG